MKSIISIVRIISKRNYERTLKQIHFCERPFYRMLIIKVVYFEHSKSQTNPRPIKVFGAGYIWMKGSVKL